MKRIAIVTSTRAEYGLLTPVIRELRKNEDSDLRVELIVTGTHISEQYGMTIEEIKERIDHKIPVSVKSDTESDISHDQAEVLVRFTDLFCTQKYDAVILLGDRYETLAIAIAAGNTRTPIFHMCGGDTTEGAIDEWIRHSITKMSYLHFVTNEDSRRRVIQLGEHPSRVFDFGSTSIDNILCMADLSREEALNSIGLGDCRYAICTYHPVTMESAGVDNQINELLNAIRRIPEIEFVVTKANHDQGGARINELLDEAETKIHNLHVFTSLGTWRYLSLMKYSEFVIGNSSSGIIEAPALHVPTVDIGERQRGRLRCESVINCGTCENDIVNAVKHAMSREHRSICQEVVSPYGKGNTASLIALKVIETLNGSAIDLKKKFYDFSENE